MGAAPTSRVLVTGAGGFVGRRIALDLRARGISVRALARRGALVDGIETTVGDLRSGGIREAAVRGARAVVHCAAVMAGDEAESEIREVNEIATAALIEDARRARVRRFVLISSVAVYGNGDLLEVREDRPLHPENAYARSKVAGERALFAASGMEGVALRPCAIYGPGERRLLPYFAQLLRERTIPLVRGGDTLFDLVHVEDVSQAAWLALTAPRAAGEAIHVAEGVSRRAKDVIAALGRALGVTPRTTRVNAAFAGAANRVARLAGRLLRLPLDPPYDPVVLAALREHRHFAIDKARALLGFVPQRSLEEGLREAFAPAGAELACDVAASAT